MEEAWDEICCRDGKAGRESMASQAYGRRSLNGIGQRAYLMSYLTSTQSFELRKLKPAPAKGDR